MAAGVEPPVGDFMIQVDECPGFGAGVGFVHQRRPRRQQMAVLAQNFFHQGGQQRMAGGDQFGPRFSGFAFHQILVESDPFVAVVDGSFRLMLEAQPGGNAGDFKPAPFPARHSPPHPLQPFGEESLHEAGGQFAGFGQFHLLAYLFQFGGRHHLPRQRPLLHQFFNPVPDFGVDHHLDLRLDLRLGAVAYRLQQGFLEGLVDLRVAQHVIHLVAQSLPLILQLLQKPFEHLAFPGGKGHQIPQMAHFGLADAVDAPEALLDPVRVPRQVVVDHQVGPLQVHPFPGGVGGHQHPRPRVVAEAVLDAAAILPFHPAVDVFHRLRPAQPGLNFRGQVMEGVFMFGEHDQFAGRVAAFEIVRIQKVGQLVPFAVLARFPHPVGHIFQPSQLPYLFFQLFRVGQIDHRFLHPLVLPSLKVFFVEFVRVELFQAVRQPVQAEAGLRRASLLPGGRVADFRQPFFHALPAPAKRLVDGLRGGGQTPLQADQGEADNERPAVVLRPELIGPVHSVADIIGYLFIKFLLRVA